MRKILSLVLSIAMVMSCFGMTAFAADEATNVVTELCSLNPTQGDNKADSLFAVDTEVFNQTGTGAKVNGTYVHKGIKYATGSFCGSADDTTVVYVGSNATDYSKNVINASDHSKLKNETFTDSDRILYSAYLNIFEGTQGNVYLMQKNQGINITDNVLHNAPLTVGQWAKVDIFYQPKVTYTYTKTNNNDATDVETLKHSTNVIREYNATDAADITKLLDGVTIESGYTYKVTAVQYGAYDTYVNGKLVYSNAGKTNVSVSWAYSTIPGRITISNGNQKANLGIYMGQNSVSKVENFDATTFDFGDYPVLADGEKYIVGNDVVELADANVTVADIATSEDYVLNVYSSDDTTNSTPEAADYVIKEGDTIAVRNGSLNIKYYTADVVEVNETAADDNGNIFTWKFSPQTGLLSIGIKEVKVYDDANAKTVRMTYAKAEAGDTSAINAACPWRTLSNKSLITDIEIDTKIVHVVRQAFYGLTGLVEITIPASVKSWGWGAFGNCTNLKKVTYEYGCHSTGGDKMFVGCTSLSEVAPLPQTLYILAGRSFWNCSSLKEITFTATQKEVTLNSSAFGVDSGKTPLNVKVKYVGNSKSVARFTALTSSDNSTITKEAYTMTSGYLPDGKGVSNSIGWELENGVVTVYDVPGTGDGSLPSGFSYQSLGSAFPWCNLTDTITDIVFKPGITTLTQWTIMGVKLNSVTVPGSLKGTVSYAINGATINDLVFEEGATDLNGATINRDCSITNLYVPSTANIRADFWRGINTAATDMPYNSANKTVSIYAVKDTAAYTWATTVQANKPADITVNVNTNYSDRIYQYVNNYYQAKIGAANGKTGLTVGTDGKYDTAYEVFSTVKGQNNAFFTGTAYKRELFAKRAYTVFEADVKFCANGEYFFFGSDQHKHVGESARYDSALVKDGWNKVVTVVDYNTGVSKTYINGIYAATTNESALWKDGDQYTTKDGDGNPVVKDCTSTRFVAYDLNGISDTVPMVYVDNMAIYATNVNPADAYAAPLTATAFDAVAGVTFTASNDVKSLDSNIVIAAAYNGNDMIGNVVIGEGSVTIAPVDGATKYVGYVWNSIEGLAPIAASVAVDVAQ